MTNSLQGLRDFIDYRIREGFRSEEQIVENAAQTYGHEVVRSDIELLVGELLAAYREEQAGWVDPTDCDRLDRAFAALNRRGIVARQDFSCCNACGHNDIWDEINAVEEHERAQGTIYIVQGYVFYHFQLTERAIEYGELLLAFGSDEDDEQALQDVGNTIVEELRRAGLDASWNGAANCPIIVANIVWRKRR